MRQRFIQSFATSGTEHEAIDAERLGKPYVAYIKDGQYIDWNTLSPTPPVPPEPVYSAMPLTFEIISGGTIKWERYGDSRYSRTIQYSLNGGAWESITSNNGSSAPSISVVPGDLIQFKGNNTTYGLGSTDNRFGGSSTFKAYGNILSLIYDDNFENETELPSGAEAKVNYNFKHLFYQNTGIVDAGNIVLPQNTKQECYYGMFEDCYNLEKAPVLSASTLTVDCYKYMFTNCSKLDYLVCLAENTDNTYYASFLNGVSNTGTFVKHPNATWSKGNNNVPAGWTIENAVL